MRLLSNKIYFIVFVFLSFFAVPLSASESPLEISKDKFKVSLQFNFEQPIEYTSNIDQQSLYIQFNQTIEKFNLAKIHEQLTGWVVSIEYGYDSLMLTMSEGIELRVESYGTKLYIEAHKKQPSNLSVRKKLSDAEIETRRQRGLLSRLEGRKKNSLSHFKMIQSQRPDDHLLFLDLARSHYELQQWSLALMNYQKALKKNPNNRSTIQAIAQLQNDQSSKLSFSRKHYHSGSQLNYQNTTAQGEFNLSPWLKLDFLSQHVSLSESALVDGSTIVYASNDQFERFSLGARIVHQSPSETRFQLFPNTHHGVALSHAVSTNKRTVVFSASINRPEWQFTEGIIGGATRDDVEVSMVQNNAFNISVTASLASRSYRMRSINQTVSSWYYDISLRPFSHPFGDYLKPYYHVEGEYFNNKSNTAGEVSLFRPIPTEHRDIHRVGLNNQMRITDYMNSAIDVGYLVNRYDGKGIYINATLFYQPEPAIDIGFDFAISHADWKRNSQFSREIGLYLLYRM